MNAVPGLNLYRLVELMQDACARCRLDLSGATVLTEAASGSYMVTPVLAAMAGAHKVLAVGRSGRYGTVEEIAQQTLRLARLAGVKATALEIMPRKTRQAFALADIVTNCGHVRPLDAAAVAAMKPTAVIPLMYEAWEVRDADVDLAACRRRGIAVAGTNEQHPAVDVFSYLGVMAVKLLLDAGVAVYGCDVVLCCDNAFAPFIARGLRRAGARVHRVNRLEEAATSRCDALLVAMQPQRQLFFTQAQAAELAARWRGVVVAQFWGDINREALRRAGVAVHPLRAPARGHMGILPSAVGPDPVVRLQSGGLKVGELMWRARQAGKDAVQAAVRSGFGQALERRTKE